MRTGGYENRQVLWQTRVCRFIYLCFKTVQMKNLPIGEQNFQKLRSEQKIYVDKTEIIHRLVTTSNYYFLSRPRRFGKSLTLATIEELFKGNRHLFKGLWVEERWDWSKTNPVVHIPFNSIGYREIGLALDIDEKTVKSRLFEARQRMRGLLHEVHAA